ncbi:MAG: hypothetical protein ACR2QE_01245 [Acidimicrobiales bacterium]
MAVLVITNAWAVLDARLAASAASREATRSAVESEVDPHATAVRAGHRTLDAFGYGAADSSIDIAAPNGFGRCAPVTTTVSIRVPALRLPWVTGVGEVTVSAHHREVVDPYRNDVPEGGCP